MTDTPNPGSPEATNASCICPRMDNGNGKGSGYTDPETGEPLFYITQGCPLHSNPVMDRLLEAVGIE